MPEKIKQYQKIVIDHILMLRDVRVVGLLTFLVIALLISWSGVKVIETNYGLQRQIARMQQQNDVQQLTNENLKLKNEYYATQQYLDIAARRNFGLAAPGETVVAVPEKVALAHTIDLQNEEKAQTAQLKKRQPAYQRNFQAWMDFLLHRQPAGNGN